MRPAANTPTCNGCMPAPSPSKFASFSNRPESLRIGPQVGVWLLPVDAVSYLENMIVYTVCQGRALLAHKSRAYEGYAKRTMERALAATRKRHAYRIAAFSERARNRISE